MNAPEGGHVLVVGVDGVRFDFLGPDSAPSVWALGQAGFLASTREFTAMPPTGPSPRAAAILAGQAPRVSFVYLGAVDFAGHATGSGTAYRAALRAADQRVGRLVAAVRARPSGPEEDWTIVVVTDHGHLDEGGHGGREPEVTTASAAAAGPGIRPGAPPLVARQEEVTPLVLAAAGCPEHRG